MTNKKLLLPAIFGKYLNNLYGLFKTLCFGLIALLASTFTGCDNDYIGGPLRYSDEYRFEYEDNEEAYYKTFDSSERTFTFNLYDATNELIYNFVTFGLSELCVEYKDGKLVDHYPPHTPEVFERHPYQSTDFINEMPVSYPAPGVEYHPLDWVTVKNIQNPGDPVTFQITISENNTGELRGFCIHINGEKWENGVTIPYGELRIYQLPTEEKTSDVNMKIRYRGEIYESSAEIDQDGCYHYDNPEFAQMIEKLSTDSNIDMIILDDEIVDYYDIDNPKYLEFLSSLDRPVDPNINCGL